jgi:hypothetical protein
MQKLYSRSRGGPPISCVPIIHEYLENFKIKKIRKNSNMVNKIRNMSTRATGDINHQVAYNLGLGLQIVDIVRSPYYICIELV